MAGRIRSENSAAQADQLLHAVNSRLLPLLVTLMITALMTGPITALQLIDPVGPWKIFPLIMFAIALEATLTTRWLSTPGGRRIGRMTYRLAEIVVILFMMRIVSWAIVGRLPGMAALQSYILDPFSILDFPYLLLILLAFFAWERALSLGGYFRRLADDASEIVAISAQYPGGDAPAADLYPRLNRQLVLQGFIKEWLIGGVVLVIFAALTTLEPTSIGHAFSSAVNLRVIDRLGLQPMMLVALIAYFLIGLWLASFGRLIVLQSRWLQDGIAADPRIIPAWRRYTLLLILVTASVTAFLPIGSTFAIAHIVRLLIVALLGLVALIVSAISLLYYLLLRLIGGAEMAEPLPDLELDQVVPQLNPSLGAPQSPSLFLGLLFWLLVITITVVATAFFLQSRSIRLESGPFKKAWRDFLGWLRSLWSLLSRQSTKISVVVRSRLSRSAQVSVLRGGPWAFFRIRGLTPREQIWYFYLSLVRRAGQKGVTRAKSNTPLEYKALLQEHWPEAEQDFDLLTEVFLEARYSVHPIVDSELGLAKKTWKRLREILRGRWLDNR